jgi:hypothetical protein
MYIRALQTALRHVISSDWFSQGVRTHAHISVYERAESAVEHAKFSMSACEIYKSKCGEFIHRQ